MTETLLDWHFKGYHFIILNLGTHPTAYVEIPEGHKLFGKEYDDCNIDVHGGVTYSEDNLTYLRYSDKYKCDTLCKKKDTWFIGWDYAHLNDYTGFTKCYGDVKWTTARIVNECKDVINQLKEMET